MTGNRKLTLLAWITTLVATASAASGGDVVDSRSLLSADEMLSVIADDDDDAMMVRPRSLANVELAALNSYFNGQRFGINPGPCTAKGSDECSGDSDNMPDYIARIQVTVRIEYEIFWVPQVATFRNNIAPYPGDSNGGWLTDGFGRAWETFFRDVEIQNLRITPRGTATSTQIRFNFLAEDVSLFLQSRYRLQNVKIGTGAFPGWVRTLVGNPFNLGTSSDNRIFVLDKDILDEDGESLGINLAMELRPNTGAGETFADNMPYEVRFDDTQPEPCVFAFPIGRSLQFPIGIGYSILFFDLGGIVTILAGLLSGVIAGAICSAVLNLDYIRFANGNRDFNNPGLLNVFLRDFYDEVQVYAGAPLPSATDIQNLENSLVSGTSPSVLADTINFRTDETFEFISSGANEVLGDKSGTPGYEGVLVINELVDSLLENRNGVFEVDDPLNPLQYVTFPAGSFTTDVIPFDIANMQFTLRGYRFTGLNTFSEDFSIGEAALTAAERTLFNTFKIDEIGVELDLTMRLTEGAWVNNPRGKFEDFTFTAGITLIGAELSAYLLTLINLEEMNDKYLGQIFDFPDGQVQDAVDCAAQAVYSAQLSSFQVSLADFTDPVLSGFGAGLQTTLRSVVDLAAGSLRGLLETKMPAITESLIKPEINTFLNDYLNDLPASCWTYTPVLNNPEYIDLSNNFVAGAVNDVLRKAIGGDPIKESSIDINTLLNQLLTDEADAAGALLAEDYTIRQLATPGTWVLEEIGSGDTSLGVFTSITVPSNQIGVRDLKVTGLNSITKLVVSPKNSRDEDIAAVIGTGNIEVPNGSGGYISTPRGPFSVEIVVDLNVCRDGDCTGVNILADNSVRINFEFDFEIDATLFAEVDYNKVMALKFEDITYFSCVIATMDDYYLKKLILDTTRFVADIRPAAGGITFNGNNRLGTALNDLAVALQSIGGQTTLTSQMAYLLQRGADYVRDIIQDSSNLNNIPVASCATEDFVIDTSAVDGLLNLPNITEKTFDPQPIIADWPYLHNSNPKVVEQPSSEWESLLNIPIDARPFDVRGNEIVETLADTIKSEGLAEPIRVLANTTFFSQFLRLNADDTVDIDMDLGDFLPAYESDIVERLKIIPSNFTMLGVELARFDFFKEYDAQGRFTTKHDILFPAELDASLTLTIETTAEFVGGNPADTVSESLRIDFKVDQLALTLITFLAVDLDELSLLRFDTFFQIDEDQVISLRPDTLACTLKAAYPNGAGIPGFQATLDQVREATITPLGGDSVIYSPEFALTAGAMLDVVVELFKDELKDITQGFVREELDLYVRETLDDAAAGALCPAAVPPPLSGERIYYDLLNSTQILELYQLVDFDMKDPTSPFYINDIITVLLNDAFLDVEFSITNLPLSYNQENFGDVSVSFENFVVTGFEDVEEIKLFDYRETLGLYPQSSEDELYISRTEFVTGKGPTNVDITFDLLIQVDGLFQDRPGMALDDLGNRNRVQDDLRISFSFAQIGFFFDLVTKVDITKVMAIQLEAFLDPTRYPCLLEAFPDEGLRVLGFNLEVGSVSARMECINVCNSPQLDILEGAVIKESAALNEAITSAVNTSVTLINSFIVSQDFADTIATEIDSSTYNCIKLGDALDTLFVEESNVAIYMGIVGLSGLFAGMMSFACLVPVHVKRRDQIMRAALLKNAARGGGAKGATSAEFMLVEQRMRPCSRHPAIPTAIKWVVPVWILINIVFFVTANFFSIGAAVQIKLSVLGDTTQPLDLLAFTLASSINDMWSAGAYPLSILIAVASGGWPYLKNILLLFTWFAPTTVLGKQRRGSIMEVLDALGKWSLVDVYVLVMLTVGFRFYISSSYASGADELLPIDALVVDVVVTPGWGIYGFVLGAMGSLFVNHLMIHWNRQAIAFDEKLEDKIAGVFVPETPTPRRAIRNHRFAAADMKGRIYGFGPATHLSVGACLVMSFLLIGIGSFLPLLTFEFLGIAGIAINLISSDLSSVTYSLFSIASAIVDGADEDPVNRLGILFLQVIYLMFAMIVPLMLIGLFGLLWYYPLTMVTQRKLLFLAEILSAWEALMVFALSVVAAVLQISQLAQFIVQNSTGSICSNLENFLLDRQVSDSDAQCFDVNASIEYTGFIIILGAVLLVFTGILMFRLIGAVTRDRYSANKQRDCTNPHDHNPKSLRGFVLRQFTVPVARIMLDRTFDNDGDGPQELVSRTSNNPIFADSVRDSVDSSQPDIDV
ncbi:Uncharacterized protein SCF082_LOCUS49152 [Durusdinium trenchii]|uniref:Uncharacterized protein n=1 Tax=Durusdinium trenchii TaxID=1381693 RepID=A0ABP0RYJ7_9DINO